MLSQHQYQWRYPKNQEKDWLQPSARQGKWPKQINFPLPKFRAIKFGALLTSTSVYLCGLRTNVTCLSRGPKIFTCLRSLHLSIIRLSRSSHLSNVSRVISSVSLQRQSLRDLREANPWHPNGGLIFAQPRDICFNDQLFM